MKRQDHESTHFGTSAFCAILFFFALAFAASPHASSAVIESWVQRHAGPASGGYDENAVAVDSAGNVVMTGGYWNGSNSDLYIVKYAVNSGSIIWEKYYSLDEYSEDHGVAIAVDGNNDVVVSGYSAFDFYTAKYEAADGALLWERRYNGSADSWDFPRAITVDGNGNVVVTGQSVGSGGDYDYYTAKYTGTDGALLWEMRYDGPVSGNDEAYAVAVDGSGNVFVTGRSPKTGDLYESDVFYTAKYAAADGAPLWEKRYKGGGQAMAVDREGNVVVAGGTARVLTAHEGSYTAKYAAADGALMWEKIYNSPGVYAYDSAYAVAVDSSGNVFITGASVNEGTTDSYTAKYASTNGEILWEKRISGSSGSAVAVDSDGNVVVANATYDSGDGGINYHTVKYSGLDGTLLWEKSYNGTGDDDDYVMQSKGLALGPNGMVAITGSSVVSVDPENTFDYVTVVYWESLPRLSIRSVPTGVRLSFIGTSSQTYQLERSPSVSGSWEVIARPVASAKGLVEYIDTNLLPGQAFYRVHTP